jgi:hypothetical protein
MAYHKTELYDKDITEALTKDYRISSFTRRGP